jgi:sporulation integral membrane protein YtvI
MDSEKNNCKKTVIITLGIVLLLYFIFISRDILLPFVIAMTIAYMLDPVVDRLEKWKIPRAISIILLIFILVSLLVLLCIIVFPLIRMQVDHLIENTPMYIERTKEMVLPVLDRLAKSHSEKAQKILEEGLKRFSLLPLTILTSATSFLFGALSSLVNIIFVVINLLIIPVATFYLLKDFDRIKEAVKGYLPASSKETITEKIKEIDTVLGAFIRGQFTVSLILAVIYCIGLYLINAPLGILIGIIAGLANIVPYLGLVVGLAPALILVFLQFRDINHLIMVLALFGAAQMLEGLFITPRIVGDKVGLHPVAIMIAILIGAKFFGFIGILLAVPVSAVLKVFVDTGLAQYKNSDFFKRAEK